MGGVCIGIYNTENNKYYIKMIPEVEFQSDLFDTKNYLDIALTYVKEGLSEISNFPIDIYEVTCCRGYILTKVREWLKSNTKSFKNVLYDVIKGNLQDTLEKQFSDYLGSIGVPPGSKKGAHRIDFESMANWVIEDPRRIKYVKTGWKSWKEKYKTIVYKTDSESGPIGRILVHYNKK